MENSMANFKTLSREDIEDAFDSLLQSKSTVTSLSVKKELRERGFWATQNEVGAAVREIAGANGYDWDFNGVFRTYYKPGTMQSTSPSYQSVGTIKSAPSPKAPPASPADREPIDSPSLGDWEVSDVNDPTTKLYFKGMLTAAQARYAYSLKTNVEYVDVRSRRY